MSDVVIDPKVFQRRAAKIFQAWEKPGGDTADLAGLDAVQIILGEDIEDTTKSSALHTWLLGYEFPSTLMVFTPSPRKVTFVCSANKAKHLNQLQGKGDVEVEIQVKGKDEASQKILPSLAASIGSGKMGYLAKDKQAGKLPDEWTAALDGQKPAASLVDITLAISDLLAEKDGEEMKSIMTSSRLTSTAMIHYFKSKMESVLDRGTKISHLDFAALVEEKIGSEQKDPDMKLWKRNPQLGEVDFASTEWSYPPIIQSGGQYDLKPTAESTKENLKAGVIICNLGLRYKSYSTSMARTFMIDPQPQQEKYYAILLEARNEAFKHLKTGTTAKDVYEAVVAHVRTKSGTMADSFVKSLGFATGIEYRDSSFVLNAKNARKLRENMVFVLSLGCSDLPDPKKPGTKYSLQIIDTVKVGQEGGINLTDGCYKVKDVVLQFADEEEEEDVKPTKSKGESSKSKPESSKKANGVNGKSPAKPRSAAPPPRGATKTRGAKREQIEQTTAEKIKANQERLHAERQAAGLKKYAEGEGGKGSGNDKVVKRYESYRREEQMPRGVEERRVYVDEQKSSVVLPINGYAVPFHISTIKNVMKTEEAEHIVLRINFQSPGQIAGKKEDMPFENPDANFIRSASFRSKDQRHMLKVYDSITGLKKAATKREAERKEMADVIEQEKIIEIKGRHPHTLKNVFPRPGPEGKKTDGNLEIHQNGVRFRPDGPASRIDVLFSNVKHLFFQPSEKELIVLIHFHLRAPIMLGKKKTYDVQFYREVTDMSFDETGGKKRRARYGDEDEIEQEQDDRRRRQELDKQFHDFARRIQNAAEAQQHDLEVDVPFRELGFSGVPFRSNITLLPTTNCLIHLSEYPFTVITLGEVEIVHLERVQFGLKNFDMVFVLQDFKKAPVHINNIPVVHLDNVKEWLDSCDVPLSEGPVNLSWPAIMKTLNEDTFAFYDEGGWGFLTGGGDDDSGSETEEGSEFEESEDFGSESSSEDDSESDFDDDDASDESGSFEDDESGEDWDELERKAKKSDEKNRAKGVGGDDDSDDGDRKKKKGGRR